MTSQEARQQVDACERQIIGTYSNLLDAARSMGSSVVQAQSENTVTITLLPLTISIIGLIFCCASHLVWGILFIIAGIFFAYMAHDSSASVQRKLEWEVEHLNKTLDSN